MFKVFSALGISLSLMLSFSIDAHAGGSVGNGGIAFVKRSGKKIISRFLDLVEQEGYYFSPTLSPTISREQALEVGLERIYELTESLAIRDLILAKVRALPIKNVEKIYSLPESTDFSPKIKVPNAHFEAIGLYSDRDQVLRVATSLFDSLPPVDQAAFSIHEVLFKNARENGIETSDDPENDVRHSTGQLFSTDKKLDLLRKTVTPSLVLTTRDFINDVIRVYPSFSMAGYNYKKIEKLFADPHHSNRLLPISKLDLHQFYQKTFMSNSDLYRRQLSTRWVKGDEALAVAIYQVLKAYLPATKAGKDLEETWRCALTYEMPLMCGGSHTLEKLLRFSESQ